jgi:hypothetical protein
MLHPTSRLIPGLGSCFHTVSILTFGGRNGQHVGVPGRSKLLQLVWVVARSAAIPDIKYIVTHPGCCTTDMGEDGPAEIALTMSVPPLSVPMIHALSLTTSYVSFFSPEYVMRRWLALNTCRLLSESSPVCEECSVRGISCQQVRNLHCGVCRDTAVECSVPSWRQERRTGGQSCPCVAQGHCQASASCRANRAMKEMKGCVGSQCLRLGKQKCPSCSLFCFIYSFCGFKI